MSMEIPKRWHVELEPGVWLLDGDEGDPPRTLDAQCADSWRSLVKAKAALALARTYRPFVNVQDHESNITATKSRAEQR